MRVNDCKGNQGNCVYIHMQIYIYNIHILIDVYIYILIDVYIYTSIDRCVYIYI